MDKEQTANDASTGLGFIMLLSGEPGVGKTLTAESGALTQPHNRLIVSY
jgi:MoxR-like ATPase